MSAQPGAAPALLDERGAKEFVAAALEAVTADDARVLLESGASARVRWGGGALLDAGEGRRQSMTITCAFGNRHASVTTPDTSREGIERAVARAEAMAKVAAPDPDWSEGAREEIPQVTGAYDEDGARPRPDPFLALAAEALADARRRDLAAAGEALAEAEVLCLGGKRGLSGFHRQTLCRVSALVRSGEGGLGWAGAASARRRDLDGAALHRRAAELCERGARPGPLDAGAYAAVLSPDAVAALVAALVPALDQRAADEGRSLFARKGLGARLFGELSLRVDPADSLVCGAPFDALGQVRRKDAWIERGAVQRLYTTAGSGAAARGKRKATALPDSLVLTHGGAAAPGEAQLLADLRRGVYLTHLRDVQLLDPMTLRVVAYAPGGAFLVEDGKPTRALAGVRIEQTLPELLAGAERGTAPVRAAATALRLACPALRVKTLRCAAGA